MVIPVGSLSPYQSLLSRGSRHSRHGSHRVLDILAHLKMDQWTSTILSALVTGFFGSVAVVANTRNEAKKTASAVDAAKIQVESAKNISDVTQINTFIDQLQKDVEKNHIRIDTLTEKYDTKIAELTTKYETMVEDRDTWRSSYDQLWVQHGQLTERFIGLQADYDKSIVEKREVVALLENANQRNQELTTRIGSLEKRMSLNQEAL